MINKKLAAAVILIVLAASAGFSVFMFSPVQRMARAYRENAELFMNAAEGGEEELERLTDELDGHFDDIRVYRSGEELHIAAFTERAEGTEAGPRCSAYEWVFSDGEPDHAVYSKLWVKKSLGGGWHIVKALQYIS